MKFETELHRIRQEVYSELTTHIIPFWKNRVYESNTGTFNGRIDSQNLVHSDADRSAILIARIAYTFAAAAKLTSDTTLLDPMHSAVRLLNNDFTDPINGGLYWMTDFTGSPTDTKKHVYAQSFGIYAYATIVDVTGDQAILDRAIDLFRCIEKYAYLPDSKAYYEAFSSDWKPLLDVRLGDSDLVAPRSTNTHLHLLEAYAALYKVWPDEVLKERLQMLVEVFLDKIYNPEGSHFYSFFDENWRPKSTIYSYGHDIETVWLMYDAAQALNNSSLIIRCEEVALKVSNMILTQAIDTKFGGIFNTGHDGKVTDSDKHWWAQAEAMVGLMLSYKLSANTEYMRAMLSVWEFISNYVIDRELGEWYFRVNRDGTPIKTDDKVGPWKCPYHTSRACIMVYSMINDLVSIEMNSEAVQR